MEAAVSGTAQATAAQIDLGPTGAGVTLTAARVVGVAVIAGVVAGAVALTYRWYVRERVPTGLAMLAGLAVVAVSLSTTTLLANEIAPDGPDLELVTAAIHVVAFLTGSVAAYAGTRAGDRLAVDLFVAARAGSVDADVSEIVQTVGRVVSVQLPAEIDDIVGYDPVPEATKEALAGRRFLFPRRLHRAELRERLVARLKKDYGVGHVDVELGDGGAVEYFAVGSRAAGIGPTLPPATNAVAVRADPAHAASAGDLVQVWETDPLRRVLAGELRGVAGDVVTVAIDAADTSSLDPTERYRLVTLPVRDRPDREFASLLRAADETMATVTVEHGSALDGATVGSLDVTVAAITRDDAQPEPLPGRDRALDPGDVLYAVATPDALRRLEDAAASTGEPGDETDAPPKTGGDGSHGGTDADAVDADDTEAETAPSPGDNGTGGVGSADGAPEAPPSADRPGAPQSDGDPSTGASRASAADAGGRADGDTSGGSLGASGPADADTADADAEFAPASHVEVDGVDPLADALGEDGAAGGVGDGDGTDGDGTDSDGADGDEADASAARDAPDDRGDEPGR